MQDLGTASGSTSNNLMDLTQKFEEAIRSEHTKSVFEDLTKNSREEPKTYVSLFTETLLESAAKSGFKARKKSRDDKTT